MKIYEVIIIIFLLIVLGIGIYFIWQYFPTESVELERRNGNLDVIEPVYSNGRQFYDNMRFPEKLVSYSIERECGDVKAKEFRKALDILEASTLLSFVEKSDGEINVLCSELPPKLESEEYFIAGEGGPSEIINSTIFSVILSGKISLFREEKCEKPQIALHEVLHVLGFDHNNNQNSIMYPTTDCNQELDRYIIDEINRLYLIESKPDLSILDINASKSGRYLNFVLEVVNVGLKSAPNSKLEVYDGDNLVKEFDLEDVSIGSKKRYSVENLKVSRNIESIIFVVSTIDEISLINNRAQLFLA